MLHKHSHFPRTMHSVRYTPHPHHHTPPPSYTLICRGGQSSSQVDLYYKAYELSLVVVQVVLVLYLYSINWFQWITKYSMIMVTGVRTSDLVLELELVWCVQMKQKTGCCVSGGDKNIWSDLHRNSLTEWICVEYSSHLTSDLHTL